jgi:hypothetical protein
VLPGGAGRATRLPAWRAAPQPSSTCGSSDELRPAPDSRGRRFRASVEAKRASNSRVRRREFMRAAQRGHGDREFAVFERYGGLLHGSNFLEVTRAECREALRFFPRKRQRRNVAVGFERHRGHRSQQGPPGIALEAARYLGLPKFEVLADPVRGFDPQCPCLQAGDRGRRGVRCGRGRPAAAKGSESRQRRDRERPEPHIQLSELSLGGLRSLAQRSAELAAPGVGACADPKTNSAPRSKAALRPTPAARPCAPRAACAACRGGA